MSNLSADTIAEEFQPIKWRLQSFGLHSYSAGGVTTEGFQLVNVDDPTLKSIGYCLDYVTDARLAVYESYPADDLNHMPYEVDFARVRTIMDLGFNGNNLAELQAIAGSSLTAAEATRATQLAL